jgi:predicted nuclease of predicted toxin-antitoxin system
LKIKLDENLPERLVAALVALGHDMDTVRAERLHGHADPRVWSAAQAAQRFFITQDLDFSDMRRYAPGTHAGLLLVRLARPGRNALFERIVSVFQTENVDEWKECLVVVTDRKIRVRRPPPIP